MLEELLGETGATLTQFSLALIAVIALIFLVAWFAKRFGGGHFGAHGHAGAELEVISALAIDPKRKLVLVRHGKLEHLLLIGGGSDEVVERSIVGGIPLSARVQANRQQDKPQEKTQERPPASESLDRWSDRDIKVEPDASDATPAPSTPLVAASSAAAVAATKSDEQARDTLEPISVGEPFLEPTALMADQMPQRVDVPMADAAKDLGRKKPPVTAQPVEPPKLATASQDKTDASGTNEPAKQSANPSADIERSLDEALAASLLGDLSTDGKNDQIAVSDPADGDTPPAATVKPAIDESALERELVAALELDTFEEPEPAKPATNMPVEGVTPPVSAAPLPTSAPTPTISTPAATLAPKPVEAAPTEDIKPAPKLASAPKPPPSLASASGEKRSWENGPAAMRLAKAEARAAEAKASEAKVTQAKITDKQPLETQAAEGKLQDAKTALPAPDASKSDDDSQASTPSLSSLKPSDETTPGGPGLGGVAPPTKGIGLPPVTEETPAQDTAIQDAPVQVQDPPIAVSGRDLPPIPVPIPSRGPAANATTLAKADDTATIGSSNVNPTKKDASNRPDNAPQVAPPSMGAAPKSEPTTSLANDDGNPETDDLDAEMRRLLGEIAGDTKEEPQTR